MSATDRARFSRAGKTKTNQIHLRAGALAECAVLQLLGSTAGDDRQEWTMTTIDTDAAARALGRAAWATYCAGRTAGRWWHRCAVPAVLRAADGASWALSQIDWAEVAVEGLRALIALAIAVGLCAHQLLLQSSERLGRRWAALLLQGSDQRAPGAPAAALAPAVPIGAGVAVEAAPGAPAGRRDRRRVHSPGLARWAASADAEPPLWWSV